MNGRKPKEPRRGPESRKYDELKGQLVRIEWIKPGKPDTTATLLWVDNYTVGIRVDACPELIVYKHAIVMLGRAAPRNEGTGV